MSEKFEEYDETKEYFGPEGHWSSKLIEKYPSVLDNYPKWIRVAVKKGINKVAYKHDRGYWGKKLKGFWGWIKNILHRKEVDEDFHKGLKSVIEEMRHHLSDEDYKECLEWCKVAFGFVRYCGWNFYKTTGQG